MKVIGLTGQTGAGKSTVAEMLREQGVVVLDADVLAREVINASRACLGDIVLEFGCEMLDQHGEINRKQLGAVVFSDRKKLRRLNEITHPHIVRRIQDELEQHNQRHTPVVVLDAPTLYEAGVDRFCGAVIAVLSPEPLRLARIMQRDSLTEEEAKNRIRSQHDDAFFKKRANFIIENTGSIEELSGYIAEILELVAPGGEVRHASTGS